MYESVESPESCKLLYVIAQSRIMVVVDDDDVDDDDVDDDDDVNDDDDVVVVNCVDLVAKKKKDKIESLIWTNLRLQNKLWTSISFKAVTYCLRIYIFYYRKFLITDPGTTTRQKFFHRLII